MFFSFGSLVVQVIVYSNTMCSDARHSVVGEAILKSARVDRECARVKQYCSRSHFRDTIDLFCSSYFY